MMGQESPRKAVNMFLKVRVTVLSIEVEYCSFEF